MIFLNSVVKNYQKWQFSRILVKNFHVCRPKIGRQSDLMRLTLSTKLFDILLATILLLVVWSYLQWFGTYSQICIKKRVKNHNFFNIFGVLSMKVWFFHVDATEYFLVQELQLCLLVYSKILNSFRDIGIGKVILFATKMTFYCLRPLHSRGRPAETARSIEPKI